MGPINLQEGYTERQSVMAVDTLDTNLLQSAKKPKPIPGAVPPAPVNPKKKRALKKIAYAVIFLWAFLLFTVLKIPDSVVANFILNALNQGTAYQWQAESAKLGFFPIPHLRISKLKMEPKMPGSGGPIALDEIRLYPNPFSLIPMGGRAALGGSFSADVYGSTIKGSAAAGNNPALRIEANSVDLAKITPLSQGGYDLKGILSTIFIKFAIPGERIGLADGELSLKGKNVVFDPAALQLNFPLPILNFGEADIHATASHGQVKIDKLKIGSPGKDLEIKIASGLIVLSDVLPNTRYELHLLIKPSNGIEKAVPGLMAMLSSMATKREDGFYAMKLAGTLAAPAFPVKD